MRVRGKPERRLNMEDQMSLEKVANGLPDATAKDNAERFSGGAITGKMNARNDCKHYDYCSAPLCPMLSDEENLKGLWYPKVEEICCRRKDLPAWVKQQRKIERKVSAQNQIYYFTLDMLKVPFRVAETVRGIDSDLLDEERQIQSWRKRYKGGRERKLSPSQREKKRRAADLARKTRKTKVAESIGTNGSGDVVAPSCLSENEAGMGNLLSANEGENSPGAPEILKS